MAFSELEVTALPSALGTPKPPPAWQRLSIAVLLGVLSGCLVVAVYQGTRRAADFDPLWIAARALRDGGDPFLAFRRAWPWPMVYPLPALIPVLPLTYLPLPVARAVVSGLGTMAFAYAVTHRGWHGLMLLASGSFLFAWLAVQWTPLMVAAAGVPALRALWAVKPTTGLTCLAWLDRRGELVRALAAMATLTALSFLAYPGWLGPWLEALHGVPHIIPPVLRPFGWLLLISGLAWRHHEGRFFLAAILLPQNTWPHEALPLMLLTESPRETAWMTIASLTMVLLMGASGADFTQNVARFWPFMLIFAYVPALVLVLRRWMTHGRGRVSDRT